MHLVSGKKLGQDYVGVTATRTRDPISTAIAKKPITMNRKFRMQFIKSWLRRTAM
jgi:hypothetical protein